MKFRIRFADQVVGAFVFLAIVAVVVLLIFLGLNQRLFSKNEIFTSRFLSSNGLSVGMGIMMKGFEVGKIEELTLNGEDLVDIKLVVYEEFLDRVRENSVLVFVSSPIGLGNSLLLYKGLSDKVIEPGSVIPSSDMVEGQLILEQELAEIPKSDDTIARALSGINPLLENTNRLMVQLNQAVAGRGNSELAQIFENTNEAITSITGLISYTQAQIGSFITYTQNVLGDIGLRSNGILDQTSGVMEQISTVLRDTQTAIPAAFAQIDGLFAQVAGILKQADSATANLTKMTEAFADPTGIVPKLLDPKGSIATLLNDNNELWKQITVLMDTVQAAASDVQRTTAGIANEIPKLSSIILETRKAIIQTQDVLEGLRNNPLLSGGISTKPQQESVLTGLRNEEF